MDFFSCRHGAKATKSEPGQPQRPGLSSCGPALTVLCGRRGPGPVRAGLGLWGVAAARCNGCLVIQALSALQCIRALWRLRLI